MASSTYIGIVTHGVTTAAYYLHFLVIPFSNSVDSVETLLTIARMVDLDRNRGKSKFLRHEHSYDAVDSTHRRTQCQSTRPTHIRPSSASDAGNEYHGSRNIVRLPQSSTQSRDYG